MPAKPVLQPSEERRRHPPEIPHFHVTILHIIGNSIRKDMIRPNLRFLKPLEQLLNLPRGINIGNRAASLCLGITRYQFVQPPKLPVPIGQ